jgi:hypothetical protein
MACGNDTQKIKKPGERNRERERESVSEWTIHPERSNMEKKTQHI